MLLLKLVAALPLSWQPYAKAVVPAFAAVLATVVHSLVTGTVQTTELEIAVVGFLAAGAALLTANGPEGWRIYAKAIVPALLTVLAVIVHWLIMGDWDATQWALAITGLGAAVLTLLTPNVGTVLLAPEPVDSDVPDSDLPDDEEEFASPPPLHPDDLIPGTEAPAAGHKPDPEKLP